MARRILIFDFAINYVINKQRCKQKQSKRTVCEVGRDEGGYGVWILTVNRGNVDRHLNKLIQI